MARFSNMDDNADIAEALLLASHPRNWVYDARKSGQHCRQFKLSVGTNELGSHDTLYLTLGCGDIEGAQWKITIGKGPTSLYGTVTTGDVERKFSVNPKGGDPITSLWSDMNDPIVAKVHDIASQTQVGANLH